MDVTFALVGPILGLPWLLGYSVPVLAFAAAGPWVLRRRGARALGLLFATLTLAGAAAVAAVGGLHRVAMGTGGYSLFGAFVAAIVLMFLLIVPAVVIGLLDARGASASRQALAAVAVGVAAVMVTSPVLALGVSCIVSGECI